MKKKIIFTLGILIIVFIFTISTYFKSETNDTVSNIINSNDNEIKLLKDGTKYLVHPDKIRSGGPPKDGIPSIDNPKFVTVKNADEWIQDNELVLALNYNGVKKVYPLQILVWHEIVNDFAKDKPILITYCPLCGSGIAYERKINNETVEFGTSGKLFNSNLIMYDRLTSTYWTQIDGLAIIGDLTGFELNEISIDTVRWDEWKNEHPDSLVLSQDTGFDRQYGTDPYGSYYDESNLFFPVENTDNSVHPKTVIYGIEINETYKAYTESLVNILGSFTDEINGTMINITKNPDGSVYIYDIKTNKEIVKERDFRFAWYAFHPETELFRYDFS